MSQLNKVNTTYSSPMPNDRYEGQTVVASCWYREEPTEIHLVLLLKEMSPYFRVAHLENHGGGEYVAVWEKESYNIVNAIEDYVEAGGDI